VIYCPKKIYRRFKGQTFSLEVRCTFSLLHFQLEFCKKEENLFTIETNHWKEKSELVSAGIFYEQSRSVKK
jgi:hypothetical protein